MGVFFLVLGVFVAIFAYVTIKVITVIVDSVRRKKYKNAVITTIVLLCFFTFIYVAAVKMLDYSDKIMSEGLR